MQLNDLKPAPGSKKGVRRIGARCDAQWHQRGHQSGDEHDRSADDKRAGAEFEEWR